MFDEWLIKSRRNRKCEVQHQQGLGGYLRAGVTSWPLPALSWPLCLHKVLTAVLLEQSGAHLLEKPSTALLSSPCPKVTMASLWGCDAGVQAMRETRIMNVWKQPEGYTLFLFMIQFTHFFSMILPLFISDFVILVLLRLGTTWA